MGTAHLFLQVAQCLGAGTCSRLHVGGLWRPALRARTLASRWKRDPACCTLAASLHIRVPWSGGGESVAGGGRTSPSTGYTWPGGEQGGLSPVGWSGHPARPVGGHHPLKTGLGGDGKSSQTGSRSPPQGPWGAIFPPKPGAQARGGTGSSAQGVVAGSCKAYGGPLPSEDRAHWPGGDWEPSQGGVRSLLQGLRGAIFAREPGAPAFGGRVAQPRGCLEPPARPMGAILFRELGAPAWGGRGAQHRGCSEPPARPMGGHFLPKTGRTGLAGTGSPAHGLLGASCKANGGHLLQSTGRTGLGGTGSPAQGVFGASCRAYGGPPSLEKKPGAPAGGGREFLPSGCSEPSARPTGGLLLQRTGRNGPGGTGSPAQGVLGASCKANGGPSPSGNRAHRPGGDWESCPGGVWSLPPGHLLQRIRRTGLGGTGSPAQGVFGASCQADWGGTFFREPGARAWGGWGGQPRGCSEPPARPMGGHPLQRTGRTGLGGTGSPAQGVFRASCKACGGPSSPENRAHQPGGDGESCPGGVRSLRQTRGEPPSFKAPHPWSHYAWQQGGRTAVSGVITPG